MDCPMRKHHGGQGESWWYCSHPDAPDGYENILNATSIIIAGIAYWCPLKGSENETSSE